MREERGRRVAPLQCGKGLYSSFSQTSRPLVHKLYTLSQSKVGTKFQESKQVIFTYTLTCPLPGCLSGQSCSNFALISSGAAFSSSFCFLLSWIQLWLRRSQLPPLLMTLEFSLLLMLLEDMREMENHT